MCLMLDQFLWGHSSRVCDISCSLQMRLHFCISDGDRQVFHGDMIIVIRVFFFIFILPLLNEIIVFNR